MGEKPMGTPSDEDEEVDPMAGAAGINTTRSNIKHASGVSGEEGAGADAPGASTQPGGASGFTGEPIPGIDTKGR